MTTALEHIEGWHKTCGFQILGHLVRDHELQTDIALIMPDEATRIHIDLHLKAIRDTEGAAK